MNIPMFFRSPSPDPCIIRSHIFEEQNVFTPPFLSKTVVYFVHG